MLQLGRSMVGSSSILVLLMVFPSCVSSSCHLPIKTCHTERQLDWECQLITSV